MINITSSHHHFISSFDYTMLTECFVEKGQKNLKRSKSGKNSSCFWSKMVCLGRRRFCGDFGHNFADGSGIGLFRPRISLFSAFFLQNPRILGPTDDTSKGQRDRGSRFWRVIRKISMVTSHL